MQVKANANVIILHLVLTAKHEKIVAIYWHCVGDGIRMAGGMKIILITWCFAHTMRI